MPHPAFRVLTAPQYDPRVVTQPERLKVFLAGSIDMGKAVEWQTYLTDLLSDLPITVFNPRRPDFDTALVQDISCEPFVEQVTWEIDHLDAADIVVFYFDPAGKAPVTLLELGLTCRTKTCLIVCPEGYWRRGNVQVVAKRYGLEMLDHLHEVRHRIGEIWIETR
ncbi:hypothetical protein HOU03_gp431 [Caulobacter phage CcrSC]|uniref:Nucleoside 2-deoxyribosyltransferase n=1 Tax=Caulobacter phage CcrSC TaxID=2283272 RepID=A0A385EG44_9CAUD|nr:hypothetical protein HOU03_gp431 [Caulobacter phage CcrSC]AXQ69837.1 hypothetical protein CcrSC_gp255c [Caulobacter phage CcrSC]